MLRFPADRGRSGPRQVEAIDRAAIGRSSKSTYQIQKSGISIAVRVENGVVQMDVQNATDDDICSSRSGFQRQQLHEPTFEADR